MTDDSDNKTPPFPYAVFSGGKDATTGTPPRVGPTMAQIAEHLGGITKRQQQMALMMDGFIGGLGRRFDVLHEELALIRATMPHPANDNDAEPFMLAHSTLRKRGTVPFPVKLVGLGTTLAFVLRLLGKHIPEYEAAIDAVLGVFGL